MGKTADLPPARGRIIKSSGGFYYVVTDEGETVTTRARGRFRLDGVTPCVGDFVTVRRTPTGEGMVAEVLPRRNALHRPPVANIDLLLLVTATADPAPNRFVLDKMLAIAAHSGIDAALVVTKSDLAAADELEKTYRSAGYPVVCVDSLRGDVSAAAELIRGRVCAVTGNTGVGKSTLLNALAPELALETGETSKKLGRGRHTTRTVELFPVCGGYVADTPGFSALEISEERPIRTDELADCFPEFADYVDSCRFTGCSHTVEKGCAVLEALREGRIALSRHRSYCALYEEAKQIKEWEK